MIQTKKTIASRFCKCIKNVRKTVKVRSKKNNTRKGREKAAIAICVKSVLQSTGKTLKKFTCKPIISLSTQKIFKQYTWDETLKALDTEINFIEEFYGNIEKISYISDSSKETCDNKVNFKAYSFKQYNCEIVTLYIKPICAI